ncbi:hypothetical protein D9M71_292510 [compost metagenome]
MCIYQFQHLAALGLRALEVAGTAEEPDYPRRGWTLMHLIGGVAQPAGDMSLLQGVFGEPRGGVAARQIDKYGLGVGYRLVLVHQYRHLAARIDGEEFRTLLRASWQIDMHHFGLLADQFEEQAHLVAIAGKGEVVELHGGILCCGLWCRILDRQVCIFQDNFHSNVARACLARV